MSAVGIESEHVGAALLIAERGADRRFGDAGLVRARHALVDIAARADGHVQRLVVRRKGEVAGPMSAAARQACDLLRGARGFHVSAAIGKAHDGVRRRDINEARVLPRRIESDPVWSLQAGGEDLAFGRPGAGARVEDAYASRSGFGHEDVAVRRDAKDARHVEPSGEKIDSEARWRLWSFGAGPRFVLRHVCRRARRVGRWEVGRGDQAAYARRVRAPVAKRGRPGADRLVSKRRRRAGKPDENEKSESHSSDLRDDKPAQALPVPASTPALASNHIEFIAIAWAGTRGEMKAWSPALTRPLVIVCSESRNGSRPRESRSAPTLSPHHVEFIVGSDRERIGEPVGHGEESRNRSDIPGVIVGKAMALEVLVVRVVDRVRALRHLDGEIEHRLVPRRKISLAIIDG